MTDACRWRDGVRVLEHRHLVEHSHVDDCDGCRPCPEVHCRACGSSHTETTCPSCLSRIRADLREIVRLIGNLEQHVEDLVDGSKGERLGSLPLGGEPMVMLGPVAPFAPDDEPAPPPTVVLVGWEYAFRWALGQPTGLAPTLARAHDYIAEHLDAVAAAGTLALDLLADDLHSTRVRLEDVLHEGLRAEHGVPCVRCGSTLVRECRPAKTDPERGLLVKPGGLADEWSCRSCETKLTDDEYRFAVGAAYLGHAEALTAEQLAEKYDVPASRVRVWGSRGLVAKRGRSADGLILYSVADVERRLDRDTPKGESPCVEAQRE